MVVKQEDKKISPQNEHAQRMLILSKERHEELVRSRLEQVNVQRQALEAQPRAMKLSPTELKVKLTKKPEPQQKATVKQVPTLEIVPDNVSHASVAPLKEKQPPMPVSEIVEPTVPFSDELTEHSEPQAYADTVSLGPSEANQATEEPIFYVAAPNDAEPGYDEMLLAEEDVVAISGSVEAAATNYEEVLLDDEVLATFEDLMSLLVAEGDVPSSADNQTYETFVQDEIIMLNPESIGHVTPNLFEEFIVTKVQPDEVPDFESVIADANEQSLEETLVQLSFSLTETSHESSRPSIARALKNVLETFEQRDTNPVTKERAITPELTQKLLVLLRAVGYENPREVLFDFMSQNSLEFLLQAIQYLYQLMNDDNRQELLPKLSFIPTSLRTDNSFRVRLGRAIVHYFFLYKIVPDL